jgi:hypothetical protein
MYKLFCLSLLVFCVGCSKQPAQTEISGTVTFKGKPIPAGDVGFTPDVGVAGAQVQMYMVKDGKYNSADTPGSGLRPGKYTVRIAGYDGKQIPMYFSGKQIFNAVQEEIVITEGTMTKDFVVPDSAGENIQYVETADF